MNFTPAFLFKFSNRIEFLQWWISIPYHLILLSSFILMILLSRFQPLKSKGVVPFLTCILFANNLIRGYLSNFPLSVTINVNFCYLESFVNTPSNLSIIILTVFNLNKFVVIQYFNYRKNLIYKNGGLKMSWYVKLYKSLNSPLYYLIYFVIFFLLQCILQAIALSAVRFQCNSFQNILAYGVIFLSVIFIIIVGFGLLVCDILLNLDKIKRCDVRKLWRSDPFFFRLEIYFVAMILTAPLYIVYTILLLLGSADNSIESILFSIVFLLLYVYLVGLPILTTIIKLISKIYYPTENKGELDRLLSSDDGLELISKACEMEYSIENLSCWKDIQDYNKEKTMDEKRRRFERIKVLYLNGSDSEMEINAPGELISKIHENAKMEKFDNDLLKELDFYVKRNLTDTFLRLSSRDEYKSFLKHKELMLQTNVGE